MKKRDLVNRLPEVLRTPAQRQFFDATFDQLFSPRNVERVEGFIGRREGGVFLPDEDVYKSEPTLERAVRQLEPMAISSRGDGEESNWVFYDDFINTLRFRGGDVSNPDRVLSDVYHSFAPPIDPDRFVNYPNYIWIPDLETLPQLIINGVERVDIQGETQYTVEDWIPGVDLTLTSGMVVYLDEEDDVYLVEGVGRSIELIPLSDLYQDPLETEDYITIQRGLTDLNEWSRTNRWIHRDAIDQSERLITQWNQFQELDPYEPDPDLERSRRARRPIVEFREGIEQIPNPPSKIDGIEVQVNVEPLFRLWNWEGIALDDTTEFRLSTFQGSPLFGYARDPDTRENVDGVLGFRVVREGPNEIGDLQFLNWTETERYQFTRLGDDEPTDIPGYYFYQERGQFQAMWRTGTDRWRQRVVRRDVVDEPRTEFTLDVPPRGDDVRVRVDGRAVGQDQFTLSGQTVTFNSPLNENTVVETFTVTDGVIPEGSASYWSIPPGLERNPLNEDITTITWNELTRHMISMIENQTSFQGVGFGANNNWRDSEQDITRGELIIQNQSPLLKAMLITSDRDVDITEAIRLSSSEYTRYRNKFTKFVSMLENEGFTPGLIAGEDIPISQWVDEGIKRVIKGREFRDAFSNTLMLPWSNLFEQETQVVLLAQQAQFTLDNFIDLSDPRNHMLVYVNGVLAVEGQDYDIIGTDGIIQVEFRDPPITESRVTFRLFEDITASHIPATPARLGITRLHVPRRELDTTYPTPTEVIVGHDGSRTPVWGDIRDDALLEFEKRIYNTVPAALREEYEPPVQEQEIRPGRFRETGWTRSQWLGTLRASFLKWSTYNGADFRSNRTYEDEDPWTWNYTGVITDGDFELRGSWRSIFLDFYDTLTPHLTPWEMLGFTVQPDWWEGEYGDDWGSNNTDMWSDLEAGTIRLGPRAGTYDIWARPGLVANHLPVDSQGRLLDTPLECIGHTGPEPTVVTRGADWEFGDIGPVEQVWRLSETLPFHYSEALFLGRPGEFGEKLWDPLRFRRASTDPEQTLSTRLGEFRRVGNSRTLVHGERVDGEEIIRTGYPVWISNRLVALGQDVTERLGTRARNLSVKLGHRVAGFTNPETLRAFVGGISTGSESTFVLLPGENVRVSLHTSPPIRERFYGGVLLRALEDGRYQVYGYDALTERFQFVPRVDSPRNRQINIGGEPESFRLWQRGETYQRGELVKLNRAFYRALETHTAERFEDSKWRGVDELPTVGGITVTVRPDGEGVAELEYGSILPDPQSVTDFLLGLGDHQAGEGWVFESVNSDTGRVNNWFEAAQQFLFWAASGWESGSTITLSPLAEGVTLQVAEGYPCNVEKITNGVYSILDGNGVMIDPINTTIERLDREISITPRLAGQGIYATRVNTSETESIITFDNITRFGDEIYNPRLGVRVPRLAIRGDRTLNWTGKLEAGGYIVTDRRLIPNFENITDQFRQFHNTETHLDSPAVSAIARHLIGFEERDYFNNMQVLDNSQYLYYRGFIRDKGTVQTINNIMRAFTVSGGTDDVQVREEWAIRLAEYGALCNETTTEVLLPARDINTDSQLVVFELKDNPDQDLFDPAVVPPGSIRIFDDPNQWITPPTTTACVLPGTLWPEGPREAGGLPDAGFVHLADVDYSVFSVDQMLELWDRPDPPRVEFPLEIEGTPETPPPPNSLIHVARTPNDWAVYTFIDDNREQELRSIRGTVLFDSSFREASLAPARIRLEIRSDGQLRAVNNQQSSMPQTIAGADILSAGEGIENNTVFDVSIPGREGSGGQLELSTVGDVGPVSSARLINRGARYGQPREAVIQIPDPGTGGNGDGDGDFQRARIRVSSNRRGNLVASSLNLVPGTGTGYVPGSVQNIGVPGGNNGVVRVTGQSDGSVSLSLPDAGTGYSLPTQLNGNFPQPPSAGDSTITAVGSTDGGSPVSLNFTLEGTGAAGGSRSYTIVDVSVVGTTGPYTESFTMSGFLLFGTTGGVSGFGGPGGDTTIVDLEDLEVEVTVTNGVPTSASIVGGTYFMPNNPWADLGSSLILTMNQQSSPGGAGSLVEIRGFPPAPNLAQVDPSSVQIDSATGYDDGVYAQTDQFDNEWETTVSGGIITALSLTSSSGTPFPTTRTELTLTPAIPRTVGARGTYRAQVNSSGVITSVTVTNAGSGYPDGTDVVNVDVGEGTGGRIQYTVSGGEITSATVDNGGQDYAEPQQFEIVDQQTTPPQAPGGPGAVALASIRVRVNSRGQVAEVLGIVNQGLNYPSAGQFSVGSIVFDGQGWGTGATIAYTVRSDGRINTASVVNTGRDYLPIERYTATITSGSILRKDYTFQILGRSVTFPARRVRAVRDVAGILQEEGIDAQLIGEDQQILIRSQDAENWTCQGGAADQVTWVEDTGISWFTTQPFRLVSRLSDSSIRINDGTGFQTVSVPRDSGLDAVVAAINNAGLNNVLARVSNGRLSILSTFNPAFAAEPGTNWIRNFGGESTAGDERTQVIRQVNEGTEPEGVTWEPGLVLFNRRIVGTEPTVIRRTFRFQFPGNDRRLRYRIGESVRVVSFRVDGELAEFEIDPNDPEVVILIRDGDRNIVTPESGRRVEITAEFNVEDRLRFLPGSVLIQDPRADGEFRPFTYEFVQTVGDQWMYRILERGVPLPDNTFSQEGEPAPETYRTGVFVNLRFDNREHYLANRGVVSLSRTPFYWVDEDEDGVNAVLTPDANGEPGGTHRQETPLIRTPFFRSGVVYDRDDLDTVALLPVYDPFKGIIPGPADRNIAYKTETDPARYTTAADPQLVDPSRTFGRANVGELWWDLTTVAYYWYEQGSNSYRRDNWGKLVPGSSVDIYEWTRSTVPPEQYRGSGTPRNTTDFVRVRELDPILNREGVFYYFWVRNPSDRVDVLQGLPSRQFSRTISASEVSRLIANPRAQNYRWFSPVSEDSFVFSGVDRVFADSDNVFQINYTRMGTRTRPHVEWELASPEDPFYRVRDELWTKMVDSLAELAGPISAVDRDLDGVLENYPDAVDIGGELYLRLPDPELSESRRLGIHVRPRQNQFERSHRAREIVVRMLNRELGALRLRDEAPGWATDFNTGDLWQWRDWWAPGRDRFNSVPTRRVDILSELNLLENLHNGDVILVTGAGFNRRASLYEWRALEERFELVYREGAALELSSRIAQPDLSDSERVQLRELFQALRQNVFLDSRAGLTNQVYFAMLNYAYSEQRTLDWVFKSTYINIRQRGRPMRQEPLLVNDVTESTRRYVTEAKPYHTKIRNYRLVRAPETDLAPGTVEETRLMKIRAAYDRIQCGVSVVDVRIAHSLGREFTGYADLNLVERFTGDGIVTSFEVPFSGDYPVSVTVNGEELDPLEDFFTASAPAGLFVVLDKPPPQDDDIVIRSVGAVKIRLGAAGRAAGRLSRSKGVILMVDSRDYEDFFVPDDPSDPRWPTEAELEAVADINGEILREIRCPFRGVLHETWPLAGTIPWDFLTWDEGDWDGTIDGFGKELDGSDPNGPLFGLRKGQTQMDYVGRFSGGTDHTAGEVIILDTGAEVTILDVDAGEVTQFEITRPGAAVTAGQTLFQTGGSTPGVNFEITVAPTNLALIFQDADPVETFQSNGLQRNYPLTGKYPTYLLEVFVNGEPQDRNLDYFFLGNTLFFVIPPPFGAEIELYSFVDAGTLLNPQVESGITQEMVPLYILDTLQVSVDRETPPPTALGRHTGGTCTVTRGQNCAAGGELFARINQADQLTAPFTYTWTRVSGGTLTQGTTLTVTTSDTTVTIPVTLSATATNLGDNIRESVYHLTVEDSAGWSWTAEAPPGIYNHEGEALPLSVTQTGCNSATNTVTPGECSGTRLVGRPSLNIQGGSGNRTTTVTLNSVTSSNPAFQIIGSSYSTATQRTTVDWTSDPGTGGSVTLTALYTVTVADTITGESITLNNAPCTVNTSWDCPPPEFTLTTRINGVTRTTGDGFEITGGAVSLTGGTATVPQGTTVTLTINRTDTDWSFDGVSGCGGSVSGSNPWTYTFTMPGGNCVVDLTTAFTAEASVSGSHTPGSCTAQVGTSCTASGTLSALITRPDLTTPPYTYTWTRAAGTTLDQGNSITLNSSSSSVTQPVSMNRTANNVGENLFNTRYNVSVTDSSGTTLTGTTPQVTYTVDGTAAPVPTPTPPPPTPTPPPPTPTPTPPPPTPTPEFNYIVRINGIETTSADGFTASTAGGTATPGTPVSISITRSGGGFWALAGVSGCGGTLSGTSPNFTYEFTMPAGDCTVDITTMGVALGACTSVSNGAGTCEGTVQVGGPTVTILGGLSGPFTTTFNNVGSSVTGSGISIVPGSPSYNPATNRTSLDWVADEGTSGTANFSVNYSVSVTHDATGTTVTIPSDDRPFCSASMAWDCQPPPVQAEWADPFASVSFFLSEPLPLCPGLTLPLSTNTNTLVLSGGSGSYSVNLINDTVAVTAGSPSIDSQGAFSPPGTNNLEWGYSIDLNGGRCIDNVLNAEGVLTFRVSDAADPSNSVDIDLNVSFIFGAFFVIP